MSCLTNTGKRVSKIGAGLLFLLLAVSHALGQTLAMPANDFLNSTGVCAHIAQGVDSATVVKNGLTYTGLRNVRDDGTTSSATMQTYIQIHQATGAKFCLLPVTGNIAASLSLYETINAAGALLAAEGPNEINNEPVTYNGQTSSYSTTFLPAALFMRDLYKAVKTDHALTGIPVYAPSEAGGSEPDNVGLQFLTIPAGSNLSMPSGTAYGDFANTHNYLENSSVPVDNNAWGAEDPVKNVPWDGIYGEYSLTWHKHFPGNSTSQLSTLPRVTTETGWKTQGTGAVTEDQQGRLFLNLFLDAAKRGWSRAFIYMLRDDPVQGYWGLIHTDSTPKLSGTYLHNLTTILADNTSSPPGSLNYSIPSEPTTVHDLLLQKSNGTFELAVWDERAAGSDTVQVNLGATFATATVYDPVNGTAPVLKLNNVGTIPLTLSDHPVIIELPTTATDSPTLPQWGLIVLGACLFFSAASRKTVRA